MELLKGNGAPKPQGRNLAIKQLICDCGCNSFVAYPVCIVAFNALQPQMAEPQVFGTEFKCKACGSWQCLKHEEGQLPKWVTMTSEQKEEIDRKAFEDSKKKPE